MPKSIRQVRDHRPRNDGAHAVDEPSAHFPKFVLHRSAHFHELRKVMGTSNISILVPLFYLKFLDRIRRLWCRNFK
jgi:hypothetical protein